MALTANGATLLSLQSTYAAQFDSFVNSAWRLWSGMGAAAVVTRIVRSVGAEWSALATAAARLDRPGASPPNGAGRATGPCSPG